MSARESQQKSRIRGFSSQAQPWTRLWFRLERRHRSRTPQEPVLRDEFNRFLYAPSVCSLVSDTEAFDLALCEPARRVMDLVALLATFPIIQSLWLMYQNNLAKLLENADCMKFH